MKEIQLTQGKTALVDDDVYDYLNQWKWYASKIGHTFYAYRHVQRKNVAMHREILGVQNKSVLVDHIDFNGLNNTKENLRTCSIEENNRHSRRIMRKNKTGYRGVYKYLRYYLAQITIDGKARHIGCFDNPVDAAKTYDEYAKQLHGDFAILNFK